jgi:hypothetical protein
MLIFLRLLFGRSNADELMMVDLFLLSLMYETQVVLYHVAAIIDVQYIPCLGYDFFCRFISSRN